MKITFDLDGVLFNGIEAICRENNILYSRITEYSYDDMPLNDKEKAVIDTLCTNYKIYKNFEDDIFNRICEKHDVHIHSLYTNFKERNLKLNFFKNYKIKDIKLEQVTNGKRIETTDIFIEDKVSNLLKNINRFKIGFLIEQPYNNKFDLPNKIIRVTSIDEMLKILDNIENNVITYGCLKIYLK